LTAEQAFNFCNAVLVRSENFAHVADPASDALAVKKFEQRNGVFARQAVSNFFEDRDIYLGIYGLARLHARLQLIDCFAVKYEISELSSKAEVRFAHSTGAGLRW